MEQNTDRMGFALIALSIVAVVLIIMNTIFGPMVKGYFQGLQKWSDNVMNQLNPPQQYEHKAYAWSADGKDRFSTIKPNYNLLNFKTNLSLGKFYGWAADSQTSSANRALFGKIKVIPGASYSLSADWSKTTWLNLYGFKDETDTIALSKYGSAGGIGDYAWSSNFGFASTIIHNTVITIPDGINYIGVSYCSPSSTTLLLQDLLSAKLKLEPGSVATPYMPSESEATPADGPNYIGTYTDTNQQGSQDPSKYTWTKTN